MLSATRLAVLLSIGQLLATASAQTATGTQAQAVTTTVATGTVTSAPTATGTSPSSSREPMVHTVFVGNGGFSFDPDELTGVLVGDTVTFEFFPPDHSVARSEFGKACIPYEYTGRDKTGFWSGVKYLDNPENPIAWNLTINSTEPIFYYCTASGSCIDHQMVGVINPNTTQTLDKQKDYAKHADYMVAPGEKIPGEGTSTLSGPTGAATASSAPSSSNRPHGLSGGAIAGIVVGGVAFLAICAALFFFIGRTKSLKEVMNRNDATVKTTPGPDNSYGPPGSPGYPGSPFSPSQAEFGALPRYSQHHATDSHPSGWASPQMDPSRMSQMTQMTQPHMPDVKYAHSQVAPAEMASPEPAQQSFTAELEAPIKNSR
ncbi:hypothetical protein K491DRAFT_754771 [Lophiostoma macrostomum CBS 122681]|uniref:Cupredoxin n=1 Tax=Lophiostoma macrostomum CBS 122681 TaxID=1314788 RepID=A0A6A6TJE1_9PLEO|nr:hypothetical protein K491DRAFT_754771 [Lophiostoma macrostomum CBS 122681]